MPEDRFAEIIEGIARRKQAHNTAAAEQIERIRAQDEFTQEWAQAYITFTKDADSAAIERVAARLLRLADGIKQRFWDFHLADFMAMPKLIEATELCLIILKHACRAEKSELTACLVAGKPFAHPIEAAHNELFEHLQNRHAHGLPFTPPISQKELAQLIRVSYPKLRGDVVANYWTQQDPDTARHRRRWRHVDPEVQAATLKKIREKLREKI